jgi:hypothetical protein
MTGFVSADFIDELNKDKIYKQTDISASHGGK